MVGLTRKEPKWYVVTEASEKWVEQPNTMDQRTRVQFTKLRHNGDKPKGIRK